MPKYRLMTPGPTQVPEHALQAMARQVRHHRTAEFRALFAELIAGLREIFQTQNDIAVLASSGTGAMEAAVVNVVPRGGKAIVLESGKFSERWRVLCERHGIQVVSHVVPWGEAFDPKDVARLLREHPDAAAVYTTQSESSTGVGHDVEAIGRVVGPTPAVFVVDAISSAGVMECRTDAWEIDLLVVGSQKALMGPPGLAMVTVSSKAWRQIESFDRPAFYFDLPAYRRSLKESETPYTPAIPLVVGLAETVRTIREEGIEEVWRRAKTLAAATRAGVQALGFRLTTAHPAGGLTAAFFPEGVDGKWFLKRLESRFGVKLAGGQGEFKGKICRIAHMGMIDALDIVGVLAAMELVLLELGPPVVPGSATAAASAVLAAEVGSGDAAG